MSRPPNLRHACLHFQSYLGEVSKIAEMLDPDDGQVETERAVEAAKEHYRKRFNEGRGSSHWDACLGIIEEEIRALALSASHEERGS